MVAAKERRLMGMVEQIEWIGVAERLPVPVKDRFGPSYSVSVLIKWTDYDGGVAEAKYAQHPTAGTPKAREPRFEWQGRICPWKPTYWAAMPKGPV
jgi:hypothetical protein